MGLTININYCRKGGRKKCARKMNGAEARAPRRSPSTRDAAAFEAAAAEKEKEEEANGKLTVINLFFPCQARVLPTGLGEAEPNLLVFTFTSPHVTHPAPLGTTICTIRGACCCSKS